jgi:hypothetical protein
VRADVRTLGPDTSPDLEFHVHSPNIYTVRLALDADDDLPLIRRWYVARYGGEAATSEEMVVAFVEHATSADLWRMEAAATAAPSRG